ncbi:MAG: Ig-like domain-containing protein, partial [Bacteroidota bacterium]|nr:Ig-like domain-containing protein [Bacteroidota bacterium]
MLLLPAWAARAQAPNWQTVLGNSATVIRGSAANASGDYYVIGTYNGTLALGGTAPTLTSNGGSEDMFLAKFSSSSNTFVWAVSGGGAGTEDGRAVAVNGSNIYITGSFQDAATISGTSLTAATGTGLDMYVAKYVDNGATVSNVNALRGGGGASDAGFSIAVNGTNVYVAGYMSANATTPVISGTTLTSAGGQDMFVARFTDSGTLANGSAVSGGGGGLDRALAIGVNSNGVYVTGYLSANATAPVIQGAAASNAGGQDMFLAKYTATLGNAGVVFGGGSTNDQGQALTISGNNIYLAGTFTGTATIAGSSLTSAGLADMFVAKYTDSGSGLTNGFAARDGGSDIEAVGDIAVSGSTVYVVGNYTNSTTLSGSSLTSSSQDAFVAKYTDLGSSLSNQGAIDGGGGAGISSAVTISLSGPQALVAGAVSTPATFGSITVNSGTAYVARLAAASTTLTSIVLGGGSPTNATSVTYTVTFASSITGLSASNFSLTSTGTIAGTSVTSVTGSGTTYTVTVNTGTGDGTLRLNLANDTGLSLAISNSPYTSGPAYTIDKTAPTVAITSTTAANGGTSGTSPFAYTVTFSEAVTGFVAGDVTVGNGAISGFAGSGTTYTFNVTPAANGAVTVNVPANVAQDGAGNGNTAATQYSITYSQPVTAAPVLIVPANGSFISTNTPTYAGTAVAGSTVTVFVDGSAIGTTTATAGGNWSLSQPTALSQGSHTVRATAQTSGSAVSANSNTNTFTVDTVQPTVAITSSTAANG